LLHWVVSPSFSSSNSFIFYSICLNILSSLTVVTLSSSLKWSSTIYHPLNVRSFFISITLIPNISYLYISLSSASISYSISSIGPSLSLASKLSLSSFLVLIDGCYDSLSGTSNLGVWVLLFGDSTTTLKDYCDCSTSITNNYYSSFISSTSSSEYDNDVTESLFLKWVGSIILNSSSSSSTFPISY
jgi:hypothetical protein